ncbi:MAG: hypothetical protein GY810_04410 [Aureispira sp.]|nr:hypothetical protein [Aureispira sp.]
MKWFALVIITLVSINISTAQTDTTDYGYYDGYGYTDDTDVRYEWERYLTLGVGYGIYVPKRMDTLGLFHGVSTEFVFYEAANLAHAGPGRFKIYGRFNWYMSSQKEMGDMFNYAFGANFSFEKAPKRKFLIPFFGLEFGGIHQREGGNAFQIKPYLGVRLYDSRNFSIAIDGGYSYAVPNFDVLAGVQANLGINVFFW